MRLKKFSILLFTLLLVINSAVAIRNLFLPRTGEIKINNNNNNPALPDNLSNVTNFQALLGAGRSLAYPFAAGMLLSISTLANENNWKVSDQGFAQVLGIPRGEILESYGALLDMLETDENVTLSNVLFSLRPNFSPSEELTETLMTEVREATWTRETWRETYNMMVEHLSNVTNEKIDTLLIPSVTKIGTPFRKATEAVVLSTFHYINGWQHPWTDGEIGKFQENPGIPYLKTEGLFLVAEEDEFTAVAVPLEGGTKNVVFVLPHANITSKYFRTQEEGKEEEGNQHHTDVVPFPTKWELKRIRLQVPSFNTTDVDQYGQELEQAGVNETFCTIIRDYYGRYPYYMRPMVQVNFLDFNEDFLELASASGVAVERFQSIFSSIGGGGGAGENNEEDDKRKQQNQTPSNKGRSSSSPPSDSSRNGNDSVVVNESGLDDDGVTTTLPPAGDQSDIDIPTLSFDRSFLWYLNDTDVGPMFFGTVEILVNLAFPENSTEQPGEGDDEENVTMTTVQPPPPQSEQSEAELNAYLNELEKFYLWSCRSFAPTSAGGVGGGNGSDVEEGGHNRTRIIPNSFFAVSFEQDVGEDSGSSNQTSGAVVESINEIQPSDDDGDL